MASAWKSYTDIMAAANVDICGIYGKDGSAWVEEGIHCSQKEIEELVNTVKSETEESKRFGTGFPSIGNKKWALLRVERGSTNEDDNLYLLLKEKIDEDEKRKHKHIMSVAVSDVVVVLGTSSKEECTAPDILKNVQYVRNYLRTAMAGQVQSQSQQQRQ